MASESSSEQPRQEPSQQTRPTDLAAVARDALELADDLERVWSSALEPGALEAAHEGLRARWSTFAEALRRVMADTDAELEAAGVDVTLKEWPPSPGSVADLDLCPSDPHVVFKQLQTALLLSFEDLARTLGALTEPTTRQVEGVSGRELARWWESGAFALARSQARHVLRLSQALQAVGEQIRGGASPGPREAQRQCAVGSYDLAGIALRRGDPEAALVHAVRAARARLASLHDTGELPEDFEWGVLSGLPGYDEEPRILQLAQEVVSRLVRDEPFGLGVAQPLARAILPIVKALLTHPPVHELAELLEGVSAPQDDSVEGSDAG